MGKDLNWVMLFELLGEWMLMQLCATDRWRVCCEGVKKFHNLRTGGNFIDFNRFFSTF
jgi:hypothetical protein